MSGLGHPPGVWGGSDVLAAGRLPALLLRGQHPDGLDGRGGAELGLRLPGDLPLRDDAVDLCQHGERRERQKKKKKMFFKFLFQQGTCPLPKHTAPGVQRPTSPQPGEQDPTPERPQRGAGRTPCPKPSPSVIPPLSAVAPYPRGCCGKPSPRWWSPGQTSRGRRARSSLQGQGELRWAP